MSLSRKERQPSRTPAVGIAGTGKPSVNEAPTMIIPKGTGIEVDVHGQLSISAPGNLVIQNSGNYRTLESVGGSIRIEPEVEVEAVEVRCASTCYIEGSLTAWKVEAAEIQLEEQARANIVLQQTDRLRIGKTARIVGNFDSEKELFLLLSRFAKQLKSIPLFDQASDPVAELPQAVEAQVVDGGGVASENTEDLPDPLFFALVLLEREESRGAYGSTSQRILGELVKLLQERDLDTLRLTYRSLFQRVVEPGRDVVRAYELVSETLGEPAGQPQ